MGISSTNGLPHKNDLNNDQKTGKSTVYKLLGKLEILDIREISINLIDPEKNNIFTKRILNTEIIRDIIYDCYSKDSYDLIPTLNGYILSKDKSLKDNFVQENDDIYLCSPYKIYFTFNGENQILFNVSLYQVFLNVFQNFYENICPKYYKNKIYKAYCNDKEIKPFALIGGLGIIENGKIGNINLFLGKDNNIKSAYNTTEIIEKINYIYFRGKNKIGINDLKFELNNQKLDDIELNSIGNIDFRNLKILILIECNIQNMDFLNLYSFSNLIEINLQKNKISYFTNLKLSKLEKLDLSKNNLKEYMIKQDIDFNDINSTVKPKLSLFLDFPKLKILNLSQNKIKSIDLLKKLNSEVLKELDLSINHINSIDALCFVHFGYLNKLNLSHNEISDLTVIDKLSFCNNIEEINLMDNNISNINVLRDKNLPNLKILNLLNNDISDYSVLRLIYLPKLETLYVYPNYENNEKNSDIFLNFKKYCKYIIEKKIEVKYKI